MKHRAPSAAAPTSSGFTRKVMTSCVARTNHDHLTAACPNHRYHSHHPNNAATVTTDPKNAATPQLVHGHPPLPLIMQQPTRNTEHQQASQPLHAPYHEVEGKAPSAAATAPSGFTRRVTTSCIGDGARMAVSAALRNGSGTGVALYTLYGRYGVGQGGPQAKRRRRGQGGCVCVCRVVSE